jgi:hypothetical protein
MAFKKSYSKEYWEIKVQEWLLSGKSARSWCKENQLVYTTFFGWYRRLKNNQKANTPSNKNSENLFPKTHFVELKNQSKADPGIFLEYEGVKIHLSDEFDPTILKKCLNVLRGIVC